MNETGREQDMLYMEELERVTEQRDRLREALRVYANKINWHRNPAGWLNVFHKDTNGPAIAAAALKEVEDEC